MRPTGYEAGHAARILWHFRDAMTLQSMMTEKDVLRAVSRLGEQDLCNLEMATKLVVNCLFGLQISSRCADQRLMNEVPYKVWSPEETCANQYAALSSGTLEQRITETVQVRFNLMRLAVALRKQMVSQFKQGRLSGMEASLGMSALSLSDSPQEWLALGASLHEDLAWFYWMVEELEEVVAAVVHRANLVGVVAAAVAC